MKVSMPVATELNEYYQSYLKYLQTDDMLETLKAQQRTTTDFWASIPASKETHRYAEGKWSVRELCGHLCDTERILSYRSLRFARKDPTELPGYDENLYTANSNYNVLSLADIAGQKQAIRESSCRLFDTFAAEMYDYSGIANQTRVSVRAILFFIITHEMHHIGVVKERYLK
jgi:uncharacterized damage-inducible protein DinB